MGCLCCLLKSSAKRKNKTKSKITPQALAPRPVQQVQPGTYSYKPTSQQPQAQQYQQSQPYQAYQPQSQYPPQGMNGGAPFDPRKAAANAAMAQQAGALAGAAFNHATGKKYQKVVNKGTDMAVKKYVESQGKQQQQQPQQQQQYGGGY